MDIPLCEHLTLWIVILSVIWDAVVVSLVYSFGKKIHALFPKSSRICLACGQSVESLLNVFHTN